MKKHVFVCGVCNIDFLVEDSKYNTILKPIICPNCGNNEDYGPIEEVYTFV